MSSQTTLTDDAPMILDATCSEKKIWPAWATIRMDIRKEAHPDIRASFTYLPFRPMVFDCIFWDPPHFFKEIDEEMISRLRHAERLRKNGFIRYLRYGSWKTKAHWLKALFMADSEFARCLKVTGVLKAKIGGDLRLKDFRLLQKLSLEAHNPFTINSNLHRYDTETLLLTMKPKSTPAPPPLE